jgi:hypothetical protein
MVMPFSLCNAPAMFERLMESILRGITYDICLVYVDDIIGGRMFQEQLDNLQKVFERLPDTHLKINPENANYFRRKCGTWDTSYQLRE